MLSNGVVMVSPLLDDDLCLFEGIEHLRIQQPVLESSIEEFAKAVVSGRVGFTVHRVLQSNEIAVLAWCLQIKGRCEFRRSTSHRTIASSLDKLVSLV